MRKPPILTTIPKPGEDLRGEEGRIGYLLRQASVAHRIQAEKILATFRLTLPQFSALTMLSLYPGISNADLARLTLLTPQTVSVIINNLERLGFIARRPHEIHGRIQHIELTKSGHTTLERCNKNIEKLQKQLVSGFSAAEEKVIRRWLISVAEGLD